MAFFLKRIGTLVLGSAAANLISLSALPLLSRLYTPDDFGLFAQYLSIVGILSSFLCLRSDDAVYTASSKRQIKAVLGIAFLSAGMFSLLFGLMGIFIYSYRAFIVEMFQFQISLFILISIILGSATQAVYVLLSNSVVKISKEKLLAKTNSFRATSIALSQLGFSSFTGNGLIYGDLIGKCFGLLPLYKSLNKALSGYHYELRSMLVMLRRNIRFVTISTPNALINVSAAQMPMLLCIYCYDYKVAGLYLMSQRIVAAPLILISRSIAQVYSSGLGEHAKNGKQFLRMQYNAIARRIFIWITIPMALIAIISPYFTPIILGQEWYQSGMFISALCPMLIAQITVTSLSNTANIVGRQDLLLKWDIFRIIAVISTFCAADWFQLTPLQCVLLFSFTLTMTFIVQFGLINYALKFEFDSIRR